MPMITFSSRIYLQTWITLLIFLFIPTVFGAEVIYAINAGGDAHVDVNGISYQTDPLHNIVGISSDYGKQLSIRRVPPQDQVLYQTERYSDTTFGYDIDIPSDGHYVLVLKYSEVYFNAPGQKVFDVVLNGHHTVVADLDIFREAGRGVAHDEYVPFEIKDGRLLVAEDESSLDGPLTVEFIKGPRDNPKINAILLIKGTMNDVHRLPPLPKPVDPPPAPPQEEEEDEEEVRKKHSKHASGPRVQNPYSADESSLMMPVIVAIGCFFPLLFCLCKL